MRYQLLICSKQGRLNHRELLQTDKIAMDLALSTEQYNKVQAENHRKNERKRLLEDERQRLVGK